MFGSFLLPRRSFGGVEVGSQYCPIFFGRKTVRFCSDGRDAWSLLLFGLFFWDFSFVAMWV